MTVDDFSPFFPLFISLTITLVVSVGGVFLSRKLGLTPAQTKYVETLEGLNEVLQKKIDVLEDALKETQAKVQKLESEVAELRKNENELKQENFELRTQLAESRRRKPRPVAEGV